MNLEPVDKSSYRIWTEEELKINGLNLFGYCRFSKATDPLAPHRHKDCLEFICLLKGEDVYKIGDQRYLLHGGDIFVSFPGQEHLSGESHQGIGEYIWLQINPKVKGNFLGLSADNSKILKENLLQWDVHLFSVPPEVMQQARQMYYAIRDKRNRLYFIGRLISFLALILSDRNNCAGIDERIRAAQNYIAEHLNSRLTIKEISEYCGMSESGLKHKFRLETGYTPCDYINRSRIACAKELLLKGGTITRAAMDTGFNSSDYFTVVFKKYTLQTPTEFKNGIV